MKWNKEKSRGKGVAEKKAGFRNQKKLKPVTGSEIT